MDSINPVAPVPPIGTATPQSRRDPAGQRLPGSGTPEQGKSPGPAATPAKAAVDAASQALDQSNEGFSFEFDDTLNGMSVKIIDKRSNTVVRLVPSNGMLSAARALAVPSARGTLLNNKA